jgi:hypothetical protein
MRYTLFSVLTDLQLPAPLSLLDLAMSSSRSNSRVSKRKAKSTSTSRTRLSTNTTNTASTGPYNRNFQQNLIDGGIYPDGYEYPDGRVPALPANWEEIQQRLAQPRPSLSPSRFADEETSRRACCKRETSNNICNTNGSKGTSGTLNAFREEFHSQI